MRDLNWKVWLVVVMPGLLALWAFLRVTNGANLEARHHVEHKMTPDELESAKRMGEIVGEIVVDTNMSVGGIEMHMRSATLTNGTPINLVQVTPANSVHGEADQKQWEFHPVLNRLGRALRAKGACTPTQLPHLWAAGRICAQHGDYYTHTGIN